jgi:hypothetical protein|tara:strand:- start:670 stop:1545 length:876 start_codon:yes stop_codon:yes gene_type:complete
MKIFYRESLKNPLRLGTKQKYSDNFSFIPIQCVYDTKKIPLIIQTPQMFVPYGIDPEKNSVCISFQNKENDTHTQTLLNDLNHIYDKIKKNLKKHYTVNHFLKENIYSECMQLKVTETTHHFNCCKDKIEKANCFSYGSFIIHLTGLWIQEKNAWFRWNLIQSRIDENIEIPEFIFERKKAPIPPPPPLPPSFSGISKYHSMIKVGVPKNAVLQKMKQDGLNPREMSSKGDIHERNLITPNMLQSISLKKGKPIERKKIERDNRIPTKEDLEEALHKLKSVRSTDNNETNI